MTDQPHPHRLSPHFHCDLRMPVRANRSPVFVCCALLLAGCSGDNDWPYEMEPVSGTVKFKDGTVPKGDMMSIRFVPDGIAQEGKYAPKAAAGEIQPDGSFKLMTDDREGAIVGKYKVVITIMAKYPPDPKIPPVIHRDFGDETRTPLSAVVKSGDPNEFHFKVKKP